MKRGTLPALNEESARPLILTVFRIRSFRFQLPADLLTSWAFEMETLILGWYVMVNTGSVLLLTAFASLPFLGEEFLPNFQETDFLMHWVEKPGTSLEAMRRITERASKGPAACTTERCRRALVSAV